MMQKNVLILTIVLLGAKVYAADDLPKQLSAVYAFHNPGVQAALRVLSSRTKDNKYRLELQMRQGAFASPLLTLEENQLSVNGKTRLEHISMTLAGGCPEDYDERPYTYGPRRQYFILSAHKGELLQKEDHASTSDVVLSDILFDESLQTLDWEEASAKFREGSKATAVIINLSAWLKLNYTESERKELPAAFLAPDIISQFDVDDMPVALTLPEWEKFQQKSGCLVQ